MKSKHRYYSVDEAAKALDYTRQAVYNLTQGKDKKLTLRTKQVILGREIERFVRERGAARRLWKRPKQAKKGSDR
jgi:hypothetical protein